MSETLTKIPALYDKLLTHFGHRNWWPAETPFEVCIGAILTQNTSWKNVVKAIANLKNMDCLDPVRLYRSDLDKVAEMIRPAGYYNVKARRLMNFVVYLVEKHDGKLESLFQPEKMQLRKNLLSINGIGRETADSIILYAAQKPIFVVDAYTKRVLHRHGFIHEKADYDDVQDLFENALPEDVNLFNDYHAQFVAVGHNFCGKKPKCNECPLNTPECYLP